MKFLQVSFTDRDKFQHRIDETPLLFRIYHGKTDIRTFKAVGDLSYHAVQVMPQG